MISSALKSLCGKAADGFDCRTAKGGRVKNDTIRPYYITDVNKPGHYPHGGWWFAIKGLYIIVSGKRHHTIEQCLAEIAELRKAAE